MVLVLAASTRTEDARPSGFPSSAVDVRRLIPTDSVRGRVSRRFVNRTSTSCPHRRGELRTAFAGTRVERGDKVGVEGNQGILLIGHSGVDGDLLLGGEALRLATRWTMNQFPAADPSW